MQQPFLETRLYIPQPHPQHVQRKQVIEKLAEVLDHPLTILSAPAGFGKTTAQAEWAAAAQDRGIRVAWLSLEEEDNDPARFFSYLTASLNRAAPGTGQDALALLEASQAPEPKLVMTVLLQSLATAVQPGASLLLFFDDYHAIQEAALHEAVFYLIEHLPPGAHLVIGARLDPPFPVGRLRASDRLVELRAEDLRFTVEEERRFFDLRLGLTLPAGTLLRLDERIEGWAAGLQLASLALRSARDNADVYRFTEAFSGSQRHVADYLMEEVLQKQPPELQDFLFQTSILERLSAPLCNTVTGRSDSAEVLDLLERSNLFLSPLDPGQTWYRYHRLFASLLQSRLRQASPQWAQRNGDPGTLHRRAAAWLAEHAFTDPAIQHALAAGDQELAAGLIETAGEQAWINGEFGSLLRWLDVLPEAVQLARPRLCIWRAWSVTLSGRTQALNQAASLLDRLQSHLLENSQLLHTPNSIEREYWGMLCAVRSVMISAFQGDTTLALELSKQALEYLPEDSRVWRGAAALSLGHVYNLRGEVPPAIAAYEEALRANQAAGNLHLTLRTRVYLFGLRYSQGRLKLAVQEGRDLLDQASALSESAQPVLAGAHLFLGYILYEWDQLEEARAEFLKVIELGRRWNNQGILFSAWWFLSLVQLRLGDLPGMKAALDEGEKIAGLDSFASARYRLTLEAVQARLSLLQGDLDSAASWADRQSPDPQAAGDLEFEHLTYAQVMVQAHKANYVLGLLDRLEAASRSGGRMTALLEILLVKAMACYSVEDMDRSFACLSEALSCGAPEGFLRVFLDQGELLHRILSASLHRLPADSPEQDYARRLLFAFEHSSLPPRVEAKPASARPPSRQASPMLVEPLTGRELEILKLIAEGFTNAEIAKRLYLALNTVKTHVKNIYAKLEVESRTQAIRRAQELRLL